MSVDTPSLLTVMCDDCDATLECEVTEYTGKTFGVDDSTLEDHGWYVADDDEHYCPFCSGKYDAE